MDLQFGIDDVNLIIYDHHGNVAFNELNFKNHKEFSIFTKILMRSCITFEIVSYNRMHKEMEEAEIS